jgi:hypothetical protein
MPQAKDLEYLSILLDPIAECSSYRPAFGLQNEEGVSVVQFRQLYGSDPLYHWIGLDSDLMYAAHKAAGGMTSIYRQLGIGCERLLRTIIMNELALNEEQVGWSYQYDKGNGVLATHTLDACIKTAEIKNKEKNKLFRTWLTSTATSIGLSNQVANSLRGAAFEIRQGYKSADSKRQNADLRFGLRAYSDDSLLPVIAIVSTQASDVVCRRYRDSRLYVMLGTVNGPNSTFSFYKNIVGYDLASLFERNTKYIREKFETIIRQLLNP